MPTNLQLPLLYDLPILVVGIGFMLILLASLEIGYRVGLARRKQLKDGEAGGGGVVLTSMFALLGLILAFTYGFTVNRYNERRVAVIIEANALGTAFLRAGLVPDEKAATLRAAILDYARTRVVDEDEWATRDGAKSYFRRTLEAQSRLWPLTEEIIRGGRIDPIEATLVNSINEVIDQHTIRFATNKDRLPSPVFWMLILIASASISVAGYNAGLGSFISRWRMSALTFVLAVVMLLIIDFDRPRRGLIRVSQEPLEWAIQGMEPLPNQSP
jgi:hypothetical protein